jgi:hypothetical protein
VGTIHKLRFIHKSPSSLNIYRALCLIVEWLEREWRRQPWTPEQQELIRQAHRAIAGLLDIEADGTVTL